MPPIQQPQLTLIHENVFQTKIVLKHAALCPTMSLLAVVTDDHNVEVWRMSGQRACSFKKAFGASDVAAISWTPNGRIVAVTRTDGAAEQCFVDTGDILPTRVPAPRQAEQQPSKLKLMRWIDQHTDPSVLQQEKGPNEIKEDISIDDWFSQTMNITDPALHSIQGQDKDIADWPKKVALLDVEKVLPKLSTLPAVEDSTIIKAYPHLSRFENASVLDTLFHTYPSPREQCVATIGFDFTEDGRGTICSSDAVHLGTTPAVSGGHVIDHASSPNSQSQLLLVECSDRVSMRLLDLDGVRQTGFYFSLLTSKLARLNHIFAYIIDSITCQRTAWAGGQNLASRFLGGINETLSETDPDVTIVGALYHLAVTGDCWSEVKEWLVDILAERGRARWTAAVANCYSTVVSLVHETLLPALDRASIIIERLQSLARAIPAIPIFNVDTALLDRISDQLQLIRILAHHVLIHATLEARQFQVFAEWLQMQLLFQATEAESAAADDVADKLAAMDYPQLLEYIKTAMMTSRVNLFYGVETPEVLAKAGRKQPLEMTEAMQAMLDQHKVEPIQPSSNTLIANLLFHAASLRLLLAPVMKAVVAGFERNLVISPEIPLAAKTPTLTAMNFIALKSLHTRNSDTTLADTASGPLRGLTAMVVASNILYVSRMEYQQLKQGTLRPPEYKQTIALHFEATPININDMQFHDNDTLAILLSTKGTPIDTMSIWFATLTVSDASYLIQLACNTIPRATTTRSLSIDWNESSRERVDRIHDHPSKQPVSLKTVSGMPSSTAFPQRVGTNSLQIENNALLTFSHRNGIGAFVPAKLTCNHQSLFQSPQDEDDRTSNGEIVILEQDERRWRVYTATPPSEEAAS